MGGLEKRAPPGCIVFAPFRYLRLSLMTGRGIEFVMRLVVGLLRSAGGLQAFRIDGEQQSLAIGEAPLDDEIAILIVPGETIGRTAVAC